MIYRILYLFFFIFLLTACAQGAAQQNAGPFLLDLEELQEKKQLFKEGTAGPELNREIRRIIRRADNALDRGPWSVTDKEQTPPSGDKHDFLDHSTYWWPDPEQPDGLPYIRRDGETNPEIRKITDNRYMRLMAQDVYLLGEAWFYTREEKYAAHATEVLRVWFLNEDTKMNPNLNFSAMRPGHNEYFSRGTGPIRTRFFTEMLDGVQLMAGSQSWTQADHRALQQWFRKYADWMQNSPVGQNGAKRRNNIGTAYDMQLVCFALFTGDEDLARRVLKKSVPERMKEQFGAEGRQSLELRRTRSWSYSRANLDYWFKLARLAEHAGVDLWNYETPSGKSIEKAFRFLRPYAYGEKEWEHEQISDVNFRVSFRGLEKRAPEHYKKSWD